MAIAPNRPPFGPTSLEDAWAFCEWRATEDVLAAPGLQTVLHAAGVRVAERNVLLVGASGSGKSTLTAALWARGHLVWGDDLVRFASEDLHFGPFERSFKLDRKALSYLSLDSALGERAIPGTVLASDTLYVSPAAFRRRWEAPVGAADVVVRLDPSRRGGVARLEPTSEGAAAVEVSQALLGYARTESGRARPELAVRVLEGLRTAVAFEAWGADPAALADAVEAVA